MSHGFFVTDSALSGRFPIYTRANVGEVFPDPVTPLTATTGLWRSELGWRDAWARMGGFELDEFPPDDYCQLGVVGGYCYLNASLIRLFGVRAPGLSWEAMDEQFLGAQPGVPAYEPHEGDERPDLTARLEATFAAALGRTSLDQLTDLGEHRAETIAVRDDRPDLGALTDRQLWERVQHLLERHRELFAEHVYTTYMAAVPVGIISGAAAAVERPDLVLPIIAGLGDVDSAAPSWAMWEMSRRVGASPSVADAFDAGTTGLHDRLRALDDDEAREFLGEFDRFVHEFGCRGPNEWETRSPTWETKPDLALAAIDRMRLAPVEMDPLVQQQERAAQREAACDQLLALVGADAATHAQVAAAIASTRAWLPGRERSKTNCVRLVHEIRVPLRELGRRMVARGAFDRTEDFGFLVGSEMDDFLGNPEAFTATVRERRASYEQLCELEPPFVFAGPPPEPSTWVRRDSLGGTHLAAGEVLAGVPGCPGVAQGIARVVLDPDDPTALEPGDVLVAPITDPSWTPLFVPASAVVVDVGAPLSHAVIVSRELGIPCVVSATGATRRIPDGALVRVDGTNGTVTLL